MANPIEMPKLSDTMEEGVIAQWLVKEGDKLESGDVIAEVETDKATMEVEIFDGGTILKLVHQEGDSVPLGEAIAIIGEEGEDYSELLSSGSDSGEAKQESGSNNQQVKDEKAEKPEAGGEASKEPAMDKPAGNGALQAETNAVDEETGRIKASPLARSMAEEKGIDLRKVKGSGPDGRIIKADIENYKEEAAAAEAPQPAAVEEMPAAEESQDIRVSQMRKAISRRLSESKFTYPHFYETVDIDMKNAIKAREQLNEISEIKISFNDLVVKASAVALKQHPYVNSSWMGDTIRQHGEVHIAFAVAIEEGLVTPVIRNTDMKGLNTISKESKELAKLAGNRDLQPEQMEGSTFSISNLGMFGIEEFTAIINPPNAAIMAVGAIRDEAVVENGEVVPGKRMKVTLSSDHRIVDGAKAADFLNTFRGIMENPMGMLL